LPRMWPYTTYILLHNNIQVRQQNLSCIMIACSSTDTYSAREQATAALLRFFGRLVKTMKDAGMLSPVLSHHLRHQLETGGLEQLGHEKVVQKPEGEKVRN
jgi:hypothetical protein